MPKQTKKGVRKVENWFAVLARNNAIAYVGCDKNDCRNERATYGKQYARLKIVPIKLTYSLK